MSTAIAKLVWLAALLRDLQVSFQYPVTLACDNTAAQHIADNPVFHNRTKHLDIDCHFVRDHIQYGFLQTVHVHSKLQVVDILTKALEHFSDQLLCSKLGPVDPPQVEVKMWN